MKKIRVVAVAAVICLIFSACNLFKTASTAPPNTVKTPPTAVIDSALIGTWDFCDANGVLYGSPYRYTWKFTDHQWILYNWDAQPHPDTQIFVPDNNQGMYSWGCAVMATQGQIWEKCVDLGTPNVGTTYFQDYRFKNGLLETYANYDTLRYSDSYWATLESGNATSYYKKR
jgi:hypothetical protein